MIHSYIQVSYIHYFDLCTFSFRFVIGLTICGIGRSFGTCSTAAQSGVRRPGNGSLNTANSQPATGYQHQAALTLPLATALTRTAAIKSQFLGNIHF